MRAVEIHRFGLAGNQCVGCGRLKSAVGFAFACPVELVAFVVMGEVLFAENKFEFFPVDLVFAKGFGKERF
ncbi:hypothetical protein BV914_05890 [Neisseria dumasiana]|nr:hypothetical protein BV914_05890 [Neisseria dumasiana]